jgi:DNA-binding PadR family transcriptional regulator
MQKANTTVDVESVTITVSGKTQHSPAEVRECAKLIAEVLGTLCMNGQHTLIACPINFQGSQKVLGLSVKGVQNNAIVLAYQPSGNGTRMKYLLHTSLDRVNDLFESLKAVIGTAYNGKDKPKIASKVAPDAAAEVNASPSSAEKTVETPKVYFTQDADKMDTLILELLELAAKQPEKQLSKSQVLNLIFETAKLEKRLFTGPIFKVAKDRGYLVPAEGLVDYFTVVGSPTPSVKKAKKTKASKKPKSRSKPKAPAVEAQPKTNTVRKQKYLSDEEWMRSFMDGLRTLVTDSEGLVSKTDLQRFIKERTNQKKVAGQVYKVLDGLKLRGLVIGAGEKLYRVVYEPKPDTLEKAVQAIEDARAETGKVFNSLAPVRMPRFAEVLFNNLSLLDRVLVNFGKDARNASYAALCRKVISAELPGRSSASYDHLLKYLESQGYLIRPSHGKYSLGPKGRERLGLPAVTYTTVTKELPAAEVPPAELAAPAVDTVVEPTQELRPFIPEKLLVTTTNISGVAEAAALVIAKATAKKVEADAVVRDVERLRARRDELKAQIANGPSLEAVEAEFLKELVERANAL